MDLKSKNKAIKISQKFFLNPTMNSYGNRLNGVGITKEVELPTVKMDIKINMGRSSIDAKNSCLIIIKMIKGIPIKAFSINLILL